MDEIIKNKNNNLPTESEEEILLCSPENSGEGEAMDVTLQEPQHKADGNAQDPMGPSVNDETVMDSVKVPSVPDKVAPQQKYEYFTGAQKRRIKAMIRDGMTAEEAKERERKRYAQVKADQALNREATSSTKRSRSTNSSPSDLVPQEKRTKKSPGIGCGKKPPLATSVAAPSVDSPQAAKGEQYGPTRLSYGEAINACRVAITHTKHPEAKLSNEQIAMIKKSLLAEMDKSINIDNNLGFISCVSRDGWLSLTCHNNKTKVWLEGAIVRLKPFPNASIKLSEGPDMPKTYVCVTYIPPEDVLPNDILLKRLAKQNVGLVTTGWRILRSTKEKDGGQCVTLSVDEGSRKRIEEQGGKLFLNFSRIQVRVKTGAKQATSKTPTKLRAQMAEKEDDQRPSTSAAAAARMAASVSTPKSVANTMSRGEKGVVQCPSPKKSERTDGNKTSSSSMNTAGPSKAFRPPLGQRAPRPGEPRLHPGKVPKWMRAEPGYKPPRKK